MSSKSRLQLLVVLGALFFVIVLFFLPITEKKLVEKSALVEQSIAQKIEKAVGLVQGEAPMQGIMLLREVLEEDSTNILAHFYLGQFSVQSGQLDKAKSRFAKVLELDQNNEYPSAHFYLGNIYSSEGAYLEAIESFEKYKTVVEDTVVLNGLNKLIKEIKTKIE